MLGVFTLGLSPTGRGAVRATHWRSRSSVLRMAGASDRMAQDGLLYDGWGAEGLKSLNVSNSLVDHADDAGVNRYDLTRIVAAQAKEIAYAHCTEDEMLNPMLAGNQVRTPRSRVPHVMRAIKELKLEIDESYELAAEPSSSAKATPKAKASPKAAREGAAQASRGVGGPVTDDIALDGDGGQANLQKLNQELLDAEAAEQRAERRGAAAGAAAAVAEPDQEMSDDGFDQLLADLSEVDMDEDDFDDTELDDAAIDDLFGSVNVDNAAGSLESSGMHPGDSAGRFAKG